MYFLLVVAGVGHDYFGVFFWQELVEFAFVADACESVNGDDYGFESAVEVFFEVRCDVLGY